MHTTKKLAAALLGCTVLGLAAQPASASLIGDAVSSVFELSVDPGDNLWDGNGGNTTAQPTPAVVGAGVEWSVTLGTGNVSADLGATSLTIGLLSPGGNLGASMFFDFLDLDPSTGSISDVILVLSTFSGVTFGFTGDSINVTVPNQLISPTEAVVFDIVTAAVPEPATLALVLLGAAGLGFSRRGVRPKRAVRTA